MKKLLSLALVLALMLSLGISAFAEVKVNETKIDAGTKQVGEITVEVNGDNVTATGSPERVYAEGPDSPKNLTVNGDVNGSEKAHPSINSVAGASITVTGDVTKKEVPIYVIDTYDGNVKVGGNATVTRDDDTVINARGTSEVVVEGKVTGKINIGDNADVYIGQLAGSFAAPPLADNAHYLIGFAEGDDSAEYAIDFIKITGNHFSDDLITGASEKKYFSTHTANPKNLGLAWITFGAIDSGKKLTVDEATLPAGVTSEVLENGQIKLKLTGDFKGGLQNLKLVLSGGPTPGPDPDPTPVIYVVPVSTVKTVEFQAPEGIEEGLITKLNSADHAGLTIDKSLLAEGGEHSVKVTLDGKELPAEAYRFCINADGSLSLTLSNTYMFSLGDGTYDLVVTVDGLEIPFTVAVAK